MTVSKVAKDPWTLVRDDGEVAVVVFDGSPRRTMGIDAAMQFGGILTELAARESPPVLVMVVDILHAELNEVKQMSSGRPISDWAPWVNSISDLDRYPSATIVAIPRQASCGGLELSLAADIRVAAPDARIGVFEARMGIIPGAGGTQRISAQAGRGNAALMCFLGDAVSGTEAHRIGLVQALATDPVAAAVALAERIASRGAPVAQAVKRALLGAELPEGRGYREEGKAFLSVVSLPSAEATMNAWLERQDAGDSPALDAGALP